MAVYKVLVTFSGWYTAHVEANSLEEAQELAEEKLEIGELEEDEASYDTGEQAIFSVEAEEE